MWFFLAFLGIVGIIGYSILKKQNESKLERLRVNGQIQVADETNNYTQADIDKMIEQHAFPIPSYVRTGLIGLTALFIALGGFNKVFFYAEPGYIYHVRTILGQERVVSGTGYHYHLFGRINDWKREMSVQAVEGGGSMDSENESTNMSASLPTIKLTMLDQVDAEVQATARFRLPTDETAFLNIAHSYRTPENLLRTSLIPQFQETLKATSSLMGAEKYYSGGRTEFQNEFESQMTSGIYVVTRTEKAVDASKQTKGSANASKGAVQDVFEDGTKTVFLVEKVLDEHGQPKIKKSKASRIGIDVVEARITDLKPNNAFAKRMELKQKASADRAIAKEQRIQEEEQKFLAIAKGDREVAERQAAAKVEQIEKTTNAETIKQLAITEATKKLEEAKIQEQTAAVIFKRDQIKAKSVKVLADATAYEKEVILAADNALQQKLDTEIEIQKVWAQAYSNRAVPQYVFGGNSGGPGGTPVGADTEVSNFMKLMTMDAAKNLNYDRNVQATK